MTRDEANIINNAMPANQLVKLGDQVMQSLGINVGKIYYLDPTNGADSNDGQSYDKAFKTLTYGYSVLRDGYNDVLVYMAGTTGVTLSAQLDWAKSYAHLIGFCAPVGVGKRARIFQLSTATGIDLLKVSGSGCVWKNIYAFHGVADATSKICLTVTGQRNYFENCHFAGIGNATMSVAGSASVKINGGAENVFKGCQIGVDTATRDADATELWLDGAATRNVFEDCQLYGYAGAAGYATVTLEDATAIDRYLMFKNCLFFTDSVNQTIAQTSVFNIKAGIVQGKIILKDCMAFTDGAAEWDSNNRGIIYNNAVAAAASAAGGIGTNQ